MNKDRCYKWGYFPEVKKYDDVDSIITSKQNNSILWVGRLIDWKHPECAVEVADRLKRDGYEFELNIIGTGSMEEPLRKIIYEKELQNYVRLCGSKSPENVRRCMEKSEIYLFTSDKGEGWGAVLNESMNSACAVVASHMIGAVPYLIKHKENGLVYKDGDADDFYCKVRSLLDNKRYRQELSKNAYYTMTDLWSPQIAAERVLKLYDDIKKGEKRARYLEGPCSKAGLYNNKWFDVSEG